MKKQITRMQAQTTMKVHKKKQKNWQWRIAHVRISDSTSDDDDNDERVNSLDILGGAPGSIGGEQDSAVFETLDDNGNQHTISSL